MGNPDDLEREHRQAEMLTDAPAKATGRTPLTEDATALVVRATRHIVDGIVEHTHDARDLVEQELGESQEVLDSIGNILKVLSQRAGYLVAQQETLLRP